MEFKLCDSCKAARPTLFCRADSAFLCVGCDSEIHAANKLASRHARVWLCESCEQAPAHVTCKADAASLCISCDRDIHSANPLASRHDRIPVTPFFNTPNSLPTKSVSAVNFLDNGYFSDVDGDADVSREEAEAASWLLPNPHPHPHPHPHPKDIGSPDLSSSHQVYRETYPYVDLNYGSINPKSEAQEFNNSGADGVVPIQAKGIQKPNCYGLAFGFDRHCLSQSVSSSSHEVGVVPDGGAMAETSNPSIKPHANNTTRVQVSGADREARVMRYREKRKNRKFEKTIRYASRKAYAETRPRIKGRFAKRTEADMDTGYGVVPSVVLRKYY